jgi:2-octaprenyl-6-methoxyphenol hydroxylase
MLAVAVVGGGPVGLTLALCLRRFGIACAVLEARPAGLGHDDRRVLALSHGTRQILDSLGAWTTIGATPIAAVHVSQQGRFGRTLIRAEETGVPALGYVAEAGHVLAALERACARDGVDIRYEVRATAGEPCAEVARLLCATAAGNEVVSAQLVAWAEGGLDEGPGIVSRDYGQQAVVAIVRTREAPAGRAYERFTAEGPVALLPRDDRYALVWVCRASEADLLAACAEDEFLRRLTAVFGERLRFVEAGERHVFALRLHYRETPIGARAVWLGNAAQTLHPVAGQGFNLALRDVVQLARLLRENATDCGSAALLARHAAARRLDRCGAIAFTDGLVRIFGLRDPFSVHARGVGLLALDLLPGARRFLARRMIFGTRAW